MRSGSTVAMMAAVAVAVKVGGGLWGGSWGVGGGGGWRRRILSSFGGGQRCGSRHGHCLRHRQGPGDPLRQGRDEGCWHKGCTNYYPKGGFCTRHCAKVKCCSHKGCTQYPQTRGFSTRHGGKVEHCNHEGCAKHAKREGFVSGIKLIPSLPPWVKWGVSLNPPEDTRPSAQVLSQDRTGKSMLTICKQTLGAPLLVNHPPFIRLSLH